MAKPALLPAYVICGSDRPKVARALRRLVGRMEEDGAVIERYDASSRDADVAAWMESCRSLGLFAPTKLVVIDAVEQLKADEVRRWIEPYLAAPVPETVVAFVAGPGMRKDHRITKALAALPVAKREQASALLAFDLPKGGPELARHARTEAERLGAQIEPEALRRLLEIVGDDPVALEQELDKLATWAAGGPIDTRAVEELAVGTGGKDPFAITDALSSRDRARVLRVLERSLDQGQRPFQLVPQLARHIERLLRARTALDRGLDRRAFAQESGLNPFYAGKLADAASGWSAGELSAALVRLQRVDDAVKGGSRLDPDFTLERAVAALMPR